MTLRIWEGEVLTGFDLSGSGRDHVTQLVSNTREGGPEGGRRNLGKQNRDDAPSSKRKEKKIRRVGRGKVT
jgi:hypothetical protein